MEYTVSWVVNVDADSPEEAAKICRKMQLDKNSIATVFNIVGNNGNVTTVDLGIETEPLNITQLDEDRWHQENDDPPSLDYPPW
jgi:hypothetical protein